MSSNLTIYKQTPSQTVGPYFAYGLCPEQYNFDLKSLFTPSIADRESAGTAHQHRGASVRW
jgi:protocatechuate 3,4-dioxygenase alpha subunit